LTRTQIKNGIPDSPEIFEKDTALSASKGKSSESYPLAKVLTHGSGPAVEWLIDAFGLDLSIVSRLGGHSQPRTHRGGERFPGMTITYALLEKFEDIASKTDLCTLINKAKVEKFLTDKDGSVIGCEYTKDGKTFTASGPVVIATGGYGADFSKEGLLLKHRPELEKFSTTNGEHCTGDGIKMALAIGADVDDLTLVQVHPTGLVNPKEPNAKVKFLAAEALRGVGGILVDGNGKRFANELGRRDYVSECMLKGTGPFRLILHSAASKQIEWHCKHYAGRGLMKYMKDGAALAKEIGISLSTLETTFKTYNQNAKEKKDEFGTVFFSDFAYSTSDYFYVAVVTPVVHYTMGGLAISTDAEVLNKQGKPIKGLYATGEVCGGVHRLNRLGGSSLLDCVVFGRVSGDAVTKYLLSNYNTKGGSGKKEIKFTLTFDEDTFSGVPSIQATTTGSSSSQQVVESKPQQQATQSSTTTSTKKVYTHEEVAKHTSEDDVWVIVNGQVLDVTKFLSEHPGGKDSLMLFAGRDATEEFNMIHKPDVIEKYAAYAVIGTIQGGSVGASHTSGKIKSRM
jgi:flavocytochrome c